MLPWRDSKLTSLLLSPHSRKPRSLLSSLALQGHGCGQDSSISTSRYRGSHIGGGNGGEKDERLQCRVVVTGDDRTSVDNHRRSVIPTDLVEDLH